ncbi:MAG: cyclopropane-fatty-acyl-phospholipid synthase family protein [Vicinamibacterales bacterium]
MTRDVMLTTATECVERGWVPDALVRWGIRRLCAERLAEQAATIEGDDPAAAVARFIDRLRDADIAPVPAKANEQHYEVPAECFRLMLGPRLKYSSCWWGDGARTLEAAEEAALRLSAAHATIEDGMRILELGCGWGSLTLWLAEQYPRSRITAVSNSTGQRAFIEAQARARRLSNVAVITADMNTFDIRDRFDRIVSVEMFEHMRNYQALLANVRRWLEPDGRLFVHVFCHRTFAYPFEAEGADNWMGRHFFSGGLMPSADMLPMVPSPFTVEERWTWDGTHYQRTSEAWLRNLDAHRDQMRAVLAQASGQASANRAVERWRVFLMACAELFGYSNGTEWGVAHYRFAPTEAK